MKLKMCKMTYSLDELSPLEAACILHGLQILAECLSDKIGELKKSPEAETAAICAQTRRVRDRVLGMTETILDAMGRDGAAPEDNEGVRNQTSERYYEGVRYQTSVRYDEEV